MSNNSIIEQIISKADIIKIIGKHVQLKKSGDEFKGCCPFHGEKTPSFFVNPDKGLYNCFGCGVKGNALTFLKEYENMTAGEALKELSQQTGIELPKLELSKYETYQRKITPKPQRPQRPQKPIPNQPNENSQTLPNTQENFIPDEAYVLIAYENHSQNWHDITAATEEQAMQMAVESLQPVPEFDFNYIPQEDGSVSLYDLLDAIARFYQQQLSNAPIAQAYLKKRGLSDETIAEFGLGYAPIGWQHLEQAFPNDIEGIKALRLIRESQHGRNYNLLRDRVIFPIRDNQGRIVGFAGRSLNDEIKPKYINSPESIIFHKQQFLYGLYESRKKKAKDYLVVEGYMDVISLYQAGLYGAVAAMGTAITSSQVERLLQLNPTLTLSFDGDNAGQKAAWRTMETSLPVLTDGMELRFLTLPNNDDPDSFVKAHGVAAMQKQIQKAIPLSQYLFSVLSQKYNIHSAEDCTKLLKDVKILTDKLPKGSYSWVLQNDIRGRLGLNSNQKNKVNIAQDALLNFDSTLNPQLVLELCFLYQPSLVINQKDEDGIPFLIGQILSLSGADNTPFFPLKISKEDKYPLYNVNDETYYPSIDEKKSETARLERILQAQEDVDEKTRKHLSKHPIQDLTWQTVLDGQCSVIDWILQIEKPLNEMEKQFGDKDHVYAMINARAHFIMTSLAQDVRENLLKSWFKFFGDQSRRNVIDLSDLATEMLTQLILDCLQKQIETEKNLVNKRYYNKKRQIIHDWFQKWLQQKTPK